MVPSEGKGESYRRVSRGSRFGSLKMVPGGAGEKPSWKPPEVSERFRVAIRRELMPASLGCFIFRLTVETQERTFAAAFGKMPVKVPCVAVWEKTLVGLSHSVETWIVGTNRLPLP